MATKNNWVWPLVILCLPLLWGCGPGELSPEQYAQWLAKPSNGLVQQRQVSVFDFSLQYWPPDYAAWRESGGDSTAGASNRENLYFVFSISPTEGKASGDALYSGVGSYEAYNARIRELSFLLPEYWLLRLPDGREIRPVLATLEHTYGLSERRIAHIVFSPPDTATHFHHAEWWDVEFRDDIFGTGVQHFVFRRGDWERAPGLRR